jgi:hypothetical protein
MNRVILFTLVVMSFFSVGRASAADFSFSNNLANDNDVAQFTFSIVAPATVTLRTFSYGGGTNAAGTTIPLGGFDPILAVFDSAGVFVDENDDGDCPPLTIDPNTDDCYDTYLVLTDLAAGDYTVTVMQYDNFATRPNLSDGFEGTDAVNFDGRTSFWAFDILNADTSSGPPVEPPGTTGTTAATPIPTMSAYGLVLTALGLLVVAGLGSSRRKKA